MAPNAEDTMPGSVLHAGWCYAEDTMPRSVLHAGWCYKQVLAALGKDLII